MAPAAPRYGQAMTTKPSQAGTAATTGDAATMTPPDQATGQPAETVASESAVVTIRQMQFNPPRVVVKKGATVTWKQSDGMPHTVTGSDGGFGSPRMSAGAEYSRTFDEAGSYGYYCSLHPSMRGEVVVVE
jgi:amicyanin